MSDAEVPLPINCGGLMFKRYIHQAATERLNDIVITATDPDRTKVNVRIAGRVLQYRKLRRTMIERKIAD